MPKLSPAEFWSTLKKGLSAPVYLVHGDDQRLVDKAYKAIEALALADGQPEFNADYFHGRDADPSEILAAANTMPMMAERRLVAVRRVEELKAPKDAETKTAKPRDQILKYLESPNPTTVFLLQAGKLDRKEGDTKLENAVAKTGVSVNFASPKRWELPKAVMEIARGHGRKMDEAAAAALVELAGENMLTVEQELAKVFLYCGDRKTIARADVLAAVADMKEAVVFEFTEAVQARDAEKALRLFRRMRDHNQEALMILGMLVRHFRQIWKIQELKAKKVSDGDIARQVGLNDYIMRTKVLPRINEYPPQLTGRVMKLLADLDFKLKSTRTDKDILFECVILKLCSRRLG